MSSKFNKNSVEQTTKMALFTTKLVGIKTSLGEQIQVVLEARALSQREIISQQFVTQNLRVNKMEKNLGEMVTRLQTLHQGEEVGQLDYENVPDVSPEQMMEVATAESTCCTKYFALPENKGKQEKFQKDMRYLQTMTLWDGAEDFSDWLQAAELWMRCVDFTLVPMEKIKTAM